jgi:hypothetical protein
MGWCKVFLTCSLTRSSWGRTMQSTSSSIGHVRKLHACCNHRASKQGHFRPSIIHSIMLEALNSERAGRDLDSTSECPIQAIRLIRCTWGLRYRPVRIPTVCWISSTIDPNNPLGGSMWDHFMDFLNYHGIDPNSLYQYF